MKIEHSYYKKLQHLTCFGFLPQLLHILLKGGKFSFVLVMLFFASYAFPFNGRKCDHLMRKKGGFRIATFLTTSAAQFTTSTGECSALGMNKDEQKKMFYYVNFEHLRNDIAKGGGERLMAFYSIYNCSQKSVGQNTSYLKKNFKTLVKDDAESSFTLIDPILNQYCQ
jgi:hypothetical protein